MISSSSSSSDTPPSSQLWEHYAGRMDASQAESILEERTYLVRREGQGLFSASHDDIVLSYPVPSTEIVARPEPQLYELVDVRCLSRSVMRELCVPKSVALDVERMLPTPRRRIDASPLELATELVVRHARCYSSLAGWRDAESGEAFGSPEAWLASRLPPGYSGLSFAFDGVDFLVGKPPHSRLDRARYDLRTFFDDVDARLGDLGLDTARAQAVVSRADAEVDLVEDFELATTRLETLDRLWRTALFEAEELLKTRPSLPRSFKFPEKPFARGPSLKPRALPVLDFETPSTPDLLSAIAEAMLALEQRKFLAAQAASQLPPNEPTTPSLWPLHLERRDLLDVYPSWPDACVSRLDPTPQDDQDDQDDDDAGATTPPPPPPPRRSGERR